jgi:hypothetical protein
MGQVSEAAVEKRAQALAERDGFTLILHYGVPQGPDAKPSGNTREFLRLDDGRRAQYLARARAELCQEARNA